MPRQATGTRSAAAGSKATRKNESFIRRVINSPKTSFACVVLIADAILISLIISYVPYTKIDWDAYMSQVSGFLGGERDYSKLEGDTGPLVYPAGFLYIYSAIQYVTGGQVYPAQILFGLLYLANLGMVLLIYSKTDVCSGAVSVKMNVLLYAPPLLLLLIKAMDPLGVISAGAGAALVQIIVGLPFILSHPVAYFSRAFNLGRVFIHFWSVNFKFVPEPVFVSKGFALFLLAAHLILLAIFVHYRWCRHEGGLFSLLHTKLVLMKLNISNLSSFPLRRLGTRNSNSRVLRTEHIATTMFVGNFIGIVCARSLHYQFYSWYFYSLPYLLWRTPFPTWLRLILFVTVEFCWNVFPSNAYSSAVLLGAHLVILGGLWSASPEYPYADYTSQKSANTKKKAS
ncbi:dol-p-man:man(5)glcnac(2)-pp-dol alpha-1 3-mannosyltransferase [Phtheirospermum japonicum]|uniref:dolichyl-P-Man:Man5GlcNAc2-PP-dolichol alpha-1,3-mannosyltransferase n=1 Tax=Phtheirospermum japonicum TaxID=374723 RepID=A0A830BMY9_9LAMI|nr:dol-p-man:man(5)glcnac(2)-pp-dol alpha-1 3-mannosyltransferase [Phtheirospermum japonicum]